MWLLLSQGWDPLWMLTDFLPRWFSGVQEISRPGGTEEGSPHSHFSSLKNPVCTLAEFVRAQSFWVFLFYALICGGVFMVVFICLHWGKISHYVVLAVLELTET